MKDEQSDDEKKGGMGVLSLIALIGLITLLIFAAPMLQEKLGVGGDEQSSEEVSDNSPVLSPSLSPWLPQVTTQLKKLGGEGSSYELRYMRFSEDESKLLLDVKSTQTGERQDLILTRDEFGRYISDHEDEPIKLYPPKQ